MRSFDLPARGRILIIVLRRLGDVLLATPLMRTIRRGHGQAIVDVLVFRGSERILKGNPDIDNIVTMPQRPTLGETLVLLRKLWRRYDLVVSTQSGDRPTFYAMLAGRRRVALVPPAGRTGAWWKSHVHQIAVPADPESHRVPQLLALATALGLEHAPDIVCPEGSSADEVTARLGLGARRYAVLHANPFYRYKRWTDDGWRGLARGLIQRGLAVVATQGRDPAERAYMDRLWQLADAPIVRENGRLDWADLTALLRGAAVYVGPDTSMTHLAAASGCATIALYGPTSPTLIGPWPVGGLSESWAPAGTIQHRGNVWVVQNPLHCLPCEQLGCARHLESHSQCLDELSIDRVLAAVDQALAPSAVLLRQRAQLQS